MYEAASIEKEYERFDLERLKSNLNLDMRA